MSNLIMRLMTNEPNSMLKTAEPSSICPRES
jgi:hypothetical protein